MCKVFKIGGCINKFNSHYFLAVLAARLKLAAVGAPLLPGFRIFSPEPFLIRIRFA
jgi:hypothetical protein